jgi:GTP-binding protein HflX
VGFIRKLPHGLVESFKSTLDEVSEADLLLHVVDISHPDYEQQIDSVNRTLDEIGAADKPTIMVFNKVDAYTFEKKDEDDLTPMTKKNWTLEMLQNSWLAKENAQPTVFISAAKRENIDSLRTMMYDEIKRIHAVRYPYNNFLW